jgi:pimeloyl-ACP methyl ester carboxylesterase
MPETTRWTTRAIRVPTLMLNGRYDFSAPPDTAQRPLFDLLGTPPGSKRHVVLDVGHAIAIDDAARETLPWFDRYLGPCRAHARL